MSKVEFNPITSDFDKVGEGDKVFGMSWNDSGTSAESFEEMVERRITALEGAVAALQSKTANL